MSASPHPDLAGRVVIVTGAGQGIGRVFARRLAEAGAIPIVAERDAAKGAAVAAEISAAGHRAHAIATDVAEWPSVDSMARETLARFGRIDALVNNAAIYTTLSRGPFETLPIEDWDRVLRVNVTGAMLCARAVLPAMRQRRWGRIVNVSSSTVLLGRPNFLHYVTSKAALLGMTRSLARELGPDGITVNTLLPGLTRTEIAANGVTDEIHAALVGMQCLKREETPADLAEAVLFLCSDASRFMTGQSMVVDGGTGFV
jgi:NAD(P)-dependent dehydrogenase (short-subunit alcohol dehydrogenase family)